MNKLISEIVLAGSTSLVVTESVSLEPLWNALITLGVSILTVLSVEGIMFMRKWFEQKTKKLEEKPQENKEDKKED